MGTHYKGNETEVLALDTYIKLVRATESLVARMGHQLRSQHDLTLSQFGDQPFSSRLSAKLW